MKIRDCATACALALALASPAAAAVKTVNFHIEGTWTILDVGLPFQLTGSPILDGSFSFDDANYMVISGGRYLYPDIVAVDFTPGNQIWALGDVASSTGVASDTLGGAFNFFTLAFDNIYQPNALHLNLVQQGTAQLYDGVSSAVCRDCVTWTVTDGLPSTGGGVPEPATWALMIAGFGLAGACLRRSRALAA
jgi:hypothetical protein